MQHVGAISSNIVGQNLLDRVVQCWMKFDFCQTFEKQYAKYFSSTMTEEMVKATKSARCHNIDTEERSWECIVQQRTSPPILPSALYHRR